MIPVIRIQDFDYPLPDERIAKYPLPERDASKLLRYRDGVVDEFVFRELPDLLPPSSIIVLMNFEIKTLLYLLSGTIGLTILFLPLDIH